jgi:hypothetical protein
MSRKGTEIRPDRGSLGHCVNAAEWKIARNFPCFLRQPLKQGRLTPSGQEFLFPNFSDRKLSSDFCPLDGCSDFHDMDDGIMSSM